MKQAVSLAVTTLVLALTACGGDGSSPLGPGPTKAKAEGLYEGTDPTGAYGFRSLILNTDEIWTVWGKNESDGFHVEGLVQGQGLSDKGNFTSSGLKDFAVAPALNLSMSATYVPGASFSGKYMGSGNTNRQFSLKSVHASQYDYKAAPKVADIAGAWSMTLVERSRSSTISIAVKASGDSATLSGSTNGCQFDGTIGPSALGKNVFDVVASFKGASCVLANQTVRGPAFLENISGNRRQLTATVVDGNRSYGAVLFGAREVTGQSSTEPSPDLMR